MRVLKWIIIVLIGGIAVLVAGIFMRNRIVGPQGWALDDAKQQLRVMMKDPDSMRIRTHYIVTRARDDNWTDIYICGVVDGKNSFGAYAGGTRFVSHSVSNRRSFQTISVQMEDEREWQQAHQLGLPSGFETAYWNPWCADDQLTDTP